QLSDVAAISTNDVWAVGYYCCNNSPSQTLAMHWNGSQWSLVSTPNPGNNNNDLWGVAALSTGDVWAVGFAQNCGSTGCPWLTLTEHYSSPCVTTTPVPPSPTVTITPTIIGTLTPSSSPTSTTTPCPMIFRDVQPSDYFYQAVRYLYCAGVISGYG